ncbi:carbohydrate kinase family protein [bacterium]|nr:carbohydrate kinase family protein [bacterium]
MSFDVVTIGNVTQDIFLISKAFAASDIDGEKYTIWPYGAKVDVPDVVYETGGFASNAAVTFARQGLKVACMGKVGIDSAGREIIRVLEAEKVSSALVTKHAKHHSAFTTILKPYNGDRTQLIHRGATYEYTDTDLKLDKLKTKWLYVGSLVGNFKLYKSIISWAKHNGAKVAFNPGPPELKKGRRLMNLLGSIDLLVINRAELEELTHYQHPEDSLRKVRQAGGRNVVMTAGPNGAWVLDEGFIYSSSIYKKVRVVDRTGAGDAYSAGYLAARLRGASVEQAMSFAAANATSVVGYIGAKCGILRNSDVHPMKIKQSYI